MLRYIRASRSHTKSGLLGLLISGGALVFAMTCPFAQADGAFPSGPPSLTRALGDPRIVLMLNNHVGQEPSNQIDHTLLESLSLKVGIELSFEGNTRTNGHILAVPIGVTMQQARQAAEKISLESGVLWAVAEEPQPKLEAAIQSKQSTGEEITRFIVKLRNDDVSSDVNPALLAKLVAAAGVNLKVTDRATFARILSLEAPIYVQQAEAIESSLEGLPEVIYADPERQGGARNVVSITPNDPLFWRGWHLLGPDPILPNGTANGYPGAANVQAAWGLTEGSASIGVAVLDTGILFDHPDLKRSLGRQTKKRGWDMISNIAIARDGNARDPDPQDEGDWVDVGTGCGSYNEPSTWHGSHVTGIIAATTNNSEGVSGINWKAKIVPVRVIGPCGYQPADLLDGILWASGHTKVPNTQPNRTPVSVISMSLNATAPGQCPDSFQEAIDYALSKRISVVVAAGNNNGVANYPPANCRGVISVASVSPVGDKPPYSNYGSFVTVAAPGGQQNWPVYDANGNQGPPVKLPEWGVWSTINSSLTTPDSVKMTYGPMEGTSMATPVVSGVVSLMVSADKKHKLTPALVSKILQETARPFPQQIPALIALQINPITGSIVRFDWNNPVPSLCTTSLLGQCGAGIVDAKAAVKAVLELQ